MTEEHQFHLQMIQHNFEDLHLSPEQAEQIVQYEQVRDFSLQGQQFTEWEAWDFEHSAFKDILSTEQFIAYEKNLKSRIQRYENDLRTHDADMIPNQIAYHQAIYDFYVEEFLPDFFRRPMHIFLSEYYQEKSKVDFLKTEYKKYIDANKKEILISHFRYNRLLMPNQLKLILVRHNLSGCWPDYFHFKHRMDEPTKAVAEYLKNKISINGNSAETFLKQKDVEAAAFSKANHEKYFNYKIPATTTGESPSEEDQEMRIMSLVLLDKDRYGC